MNQPTKNTSGTPKAHELQQLSTLLEQALRQAQVGEDASHDVYHARRVKQNAFAIATLEGTGDLVVLSAAAYLHDLVNLPKNAPNRDQASQLSAVAAKPILQRLNLNDETIDRVAHCIESHSFSAGIPAETIDAKILQDADRLESLGALGIARTFYIAGKMQSDLFHGEDPFAANRTLNDKQFAVDHFKIKLLTLAETMQTGAGKTIAHERTASMRQFLDALGQEVGASHNW